MKQTIVKKHQAEIDALCRRYHVKRLDLFGSAVSEDFDPDASDLDFLVEFKAMEPVPYKNAYFGLLEALRELFDRPIDLVTRRSMRNPYFISAVDDSRQVLYGT